MESRTLFCLFSLLSNLCFPLCLAVAIKHRLTNICDKADRFTTATQIFPIPVGPSTFIQAKVPTAEVSIIQVDTKMNENHTVSIIFPVLESLDNQKFPYFPLNRICGFSGNFRRIGMAKRIPADWLLFCEHESPLPVCYSNGTGSYFVADFKIRMSNWDG